MVQILTVCRIDTGWGFRDVTGAEYGRSHNLKYSFEIARRMAQRVGAQVQFTPEAERAFRDVMEEELPAAPRNPVKPQIPTGFRALAGRLAKWRKR